MIPAYLIPEPRNAPLVREAAIPARSAEARGIEAKPAANAERVAADVADSPTQAGKARAAARPKKSSVYTVAAGKLNTSKGTSLS